ncbi:MAG: N-6 DNA methylase, partial [Nitrosotalea sp.]
MSAEIESFDKEKAKSEIKILIEKYEREKSNGKLESYSEEQTKNDFILRLFKALGWDVYNDHSNTLTAEEKASRGRVDYGFRINDIPKFFLEAKSFRAGVDKDEYAFQSINYSWLKGCTWAVLTNFEKLIIFNAEWKEKLAVNCLFISLTHADFLTNFDQLYLLSREAFVKNLLDKEAEKWHKKIKKTPIDQQLLQDLMKFREALTQSIMRRNSSVSLTDEELDESVQKILDRIIFIRTVEDRQIEPPHLRPLIREDHKGNLWKKIAELYRYFDDTYDSNLFSPHECEKLVIGDEELETVIRGLHETEDGSVQYDFSAINADVLGTVYEQYLGHILKKTKKSATIQDGSAKRKKQGIYYTPTYIVDYIVKNTVGSKIAEMGLDWKKIKILDPACGSGSFLIKAFDYLTTLDKELEKKEELKKELYGTHIATERFGYLKNNIFGVDLDTKAVEIAQLNLMIRATEKKERLPSLQQNIKHGNSLIGDAKIDKDAALDWNEQFKEIMNNGKFDIVIGNPPYISSLLLTKSVSTT